MDTPGLPASTADLAAEAAGQLGWSGQVLPEAALMGRTVHVCARLRTDVHAERIAVGAEPELDRSAVSTWLWPEMAETAPPAAAEVDGVLAVARHWRTALAWTVPFARHFEVAIVLPAALTVTHDYVNNALPRVRAYGVNVLTVDDEGIVRRDIAVDRDPTPPMEDDVSRWLNEQVYHQLLQDIEAVEQV